jgi:hypothetical protein
VLNHVGARLGTDAGNPGLVVWEGKVEELDIGIDGTVTVGGMALTANDLTLRYDAPSGRIQVVGGLGLSLAAGKIKAAATLTGDGFTFDPASGKAVLNGLKFEADADLGAVQVHGLVVEYKTQNGRTTWFAAGSVQLAPGVEVGGAFEIVNGKLNRIALSYDKGTGLGIPILDTGLYLTHVGGDIRNLTNPSALRVSVDAEVTFGRTVRFMGTEYSIFQAKGKVTVTKDELKLDGGIKLANGYMGSGSANVDLNWAEKKYSVGYDVKMYYGTFHQVGKLALDGTAISFDGKATLEAPTVIQNELKKFGLPTEYAGAAFRVRMDPDKPASENYAEASFDAAGFTVTVRYDFANNMSFSIFNGALKALTKTIDAAGHAIAQTFDKAGKQVVQTVNETFKDGSVLVKRVTTETWGTVTELADAAGKVMTRIYDEGGYLSTDTLDAAGNTAKRVTKYGAEITTELWTATGHSLERIQGDGVRFFSNQVYATGKEVQTWSRNGAAYLRVTLQGGSETVRETWDEGYSLGKAGAKYFKGQITAAGTVIQSQYTNGAGWIRYTFEAGGRTIREIADAANHYKKEIKEAGKKTWHTVTNTFEDAGDTVADGFTSVGNTIGGAFS